MLTKEKTLIIYLASPYTHEDEKVREFRFEKACEKAAELMQKGYIVFCPISHSHPISKYIKNSCDYRFYLRQDLPFISFCDEVWVLCLDGWGESKGVNIEISYAMKLKKKVRYLP